MNKTGTALPKQAQNKFSMEKIQSSYTQSLEQLVQLMSEIIRALCDEDSLDNTEINQLGQLHIELKYTQKLKSEEADFKELLSRHVEQALLSLKARQDQFPKIKPMKSQNQSELATIAEKYSEQNILSSYLRKNSHHKLYQHGQSKNAKNSSEFEMYSETLHLGSQVNREETRRSLDFSTDDKKPLYKDLQRIRAKQPQPMRIYQQPKKFIVKSKLPQYNISKYL